MARSKEPGPESQPFANSKDAVPYRYDDADAFDVRDPANAPRPDSDALPKVNIVPRDPTKSGGATSPAEQIKPAEPSRKPFLTPDTSSAPPPKATAPPIEQNLDFARPVPGKRGLVYPPGVKESAENMVDVSGFETGQIVRDPRTGKLFRVP